MDPTKPTIIHQTSKGMRCFQFHALFETNLDDKQAVVHRRGTMEHNTM